MLDVRVSRLTLFPIKSLDGVDVDSAAVLHSGALKYDRELVICDPDGRWINGKRDSRLNLVRAEYNLDTLQVQLQSPASFPEWDTFNFRGERKRLEDWFGNYLGMRVVVQENRESGFPDDLHALGPTIISTGTLSKLDSWFDINDIEETRRRFRTNIEVNVSIPFWEDRLFGKRRNPPKFAVGGAVFLGSGPCKRCVVPTRDSRTGKVTEGFATEFASRRKEGLPPWSTRERFGPLFYRVAVNTQPADGSTARCISVGDPVAILSNGCTV